MPFSLSARRAVVTASVALGATLLSVTAAFAAQPVPQADDSRAVVSAPRTNAVTCAEVSVAGAVHGLTGQTIAGDSLAGTGVVASVDSTNTYITITGLPANFTVSGVVVKGGDAYNVYFANKLGALPWNALHAPTAGNSGGPATISHWFLCGSVAQGGSGGGPSSSSPATTPSTSSSSSSSSTSASTSASSETTGPSGSSTQSTGSSATTSTTSAVAAAGAGTGGPSNLASTGVDAGPFVLSAAVLLLVGAALLLTLRAKARLHKRA